MRTLESSISQREARINALDSELGTTLDTVTRLQSELRSAEQRAEQSRQALETALDNSARSNRPRPACRVRFRTANSASSRLNQEIRTLKKSLASAETQAVETLTLSEKRHEVALPKCRKHSPTSTRYAAKSKISSPISPSASSG